MEHLLRDPEGNRLELYTTTPWYVSQPWRVALDLGDSDEVIHQTTRKLIDESGTSWAPIESWKEGLAGPPVCHREGEGERALMSAETTPEAEPAYRSIWTALSNVSFTQSWLDVGGVSTRYAEAGPRNAPAVLMLHGTGGHWETFASNLGPMSKHFRCVAIDMVGNGFSAKPDFDYEIPVYVDHAFATLDALGIERASMIGTSLGSWVAARSALTHPDRVEKLILMSPAGLVATESNMHRIRAERTGGRR